MVVRPGYEASMCATVEKSAPDRSKPYFQPRRAAWSLISPRGDCAHEVREEEMRGRGRKGEVAGEELGLQNPSSIRR